MRPLGWHPARLSIDWTLVAMLLALALVLAGAVRLASHSVERTQTETIGLQTIAGIAGEPPPPVEPLELKRLPTEQAVAINAAVPVIPGTPPAATPFRFTGDPASFARAATCLAATAWYEAGDDQTGQRSVMQVVLNRVRHPAYPRSVCAVVFQGSERATGCQFTFTCDGALRRRPSEAAWTRATDQASAMLNGSVDRSVGWATHYHTDWVVPYWSASLDKIAKVRTHLFFRWRGSWGQRGAFRQTPMSAEPVVPRIAWLNPAHALTALADADLDSLGGPPLDGTLPPVGELGGDASGVPATPTSAVTAGPALAAALPKRMRVTGQSSNGSVVLAEVPPGSAPGDHALDALRICRGRNRCTVVGWPAGVLRPAADNTGAIARSRPLFVFLQDGRQQRQDALWDCRRIQRPNADECLPGGADVLAGLIQRQPAGVAAPAPAPAPKPGRPPASPAGTP